MYQFEQVNKNNELQIVKSMMGRELIPFEQGVVAYQNRISHINNPFPELDWRHDEWFNGWLNESNCDPNGDYDWVKKEFID